MNDKKNTGPIRDQELLGLLKPIRNTGTMEPNNQERAFRNTAADIRQFNEITKESTVQGLLSSTDQFLLRGFGALQITEIFLLRDSKGKVQLLAKCKCRCGNIITTPLRDVIKGAVTNCGCITPIPKSSLKNTTVYQSQNANNWSTTVDGIQWLGKRYTWFVTFLDNPQKQLNRYVDTAAEALTLRRNAEVEYYGASPIDQYYEVMLQELEEIERVYIKKHPPTVQGIFYRKETGRWTTRLWNGGKLIINQSYKTREEAVQARYEAEVKAYGKAMMPKRFYV